MAVNYQPTEEDKRRAANLFLGLTPSVAAAYKTDPQTAIAKALMQAGTDSSPVASGGWGIAEGLGRIGSGALGKVANDREQRAYALRDAGIQGKANDALAAQLGPPTPTAPVAPVDPAAAAAPVPPPQAPPAAQGIAQALSAPPGGVPPANPTPALPPTVQGSVSPHPPMTSGASLTPPPASPSLAATPPTVPATVPSGRGAVASAGNNPGGINDSAFARRQPGYTGANGRFASFATPEAGAAAQTTLLRSYINRGYDTPLKIATRWAPKGDGANDPAVYAATIAKQMGIGPNDKVTRQNLNQFQVAQAALETGGKSGGGMVVAGNAQTADNGEVDPTLSAPVPVPDLPAAPGPVERPKLADRVRSDRLEIARRILGSGGSAVDIGAAMQPYLDSGLTEDQKSKEDQYNTENDLTKTAYTSGLNEAAQGRQSLLEAGINRNNYAQKQNYDLQLERMREAAATRLEEGRSSAALALQDAKQGAGKVLTPGLNKTITTQVSALSRLAESMQTFKKSYFGYGIDALGDAADKTTNVLSSLGLSSHDQDARVAWRKNFNQAQNIDRHELFGGALSPKEAALWDAANTTSGTSPAIAAANMNTKFNIALSALRKQVAAATAAGYNTDQIRELVGEPTLKLLTEGKVNNPELETNPSLPPAARTARPAGTPRKSTGPGANTIVINGVPYTKQPDGSWTY